MARRPSTFEEAQNDDHWCGICGERHDSPGTVLSHERAAGYMDEKFGVSI